MRVSKELEIDMGHAVTNHNSKCKHMHGHRYLIRAWVDDIVIQEEGSSEGMVIDFSDLKNALVEVIDEPYDHAFVMWRGDPRIGLLQQAHEMWHNDFNKFHGLDFVPTAENLAKHWFHTLKDHLIDLYGIQLVQLDVYETPTSCAVYTLENYNEENA